MKKLKLLADHRLIALQSCARGIHTSIQFKMGGTPRCSICGQQFSGDGKGDYQPIGENPAPKLLAEILTKKAV